jgi:capsular exopolysaccharide synthesis family protein
MAASFDTYGAKNPHLAELRQQVAFFDTQISEEISRLLATVQSTLKIAQESETRVKKELADLEHQADGVNDAGVRLAVLQQEADSSRALYEDLYTKLEEERLDQQTQASNVAVISDALPSHKPHFPNWPLNIALGLGGGLIFGVVGAFLKETLDDTIVTTTQIEGVTRVPVLGLVPKFVNGAGLPGNKGRAELTAAVTDSHMAMEEPDSPAAEAYRALRTALLLSQAGTPPRTLLFTSSLPSEGKTTTCSNLAACFAIMGRKVLVVDADMRRPALHRHMKESNAEGLSTLLTSSADSAQVIRPHPVVANLSILSAGPVPPNPAELLSSQTFTTFVADVSQQYDLVLIDSPPALLVADAAIISALVDGVVMVVRAGSSTRLTMRRLIENLQRHQASLVGFVLNSADTNSSEHYYAYGYSGKKYYGKYYGKNGSGKNRNGQA